MAMLIPSLWEWLLCIVALLAVYDVIFGKRAPLKAPSPRKEPPKIHVFIPNYHNLRWAKRNVALLRHHASDKGIKITVMTQEQATSERQVVSWAMRPFNAEVVDLSGPTAGKVGGNALPAFFSAAMNHSTAEITVFADSDTLVFKENWDVLLRELFEDENLGVVSINPRSHMEEFKRQVEWNWMAVRTGLYRDLIHSIETDMNRLRIHDWGHWFKDVAGSHGFAWHLFPCYGLIKDVRSKAVIANAGHYYKNLTDIFAVHSFYGSRRRSENLTGVPVVQDEQLERLERMARTYTFSKQSEYFIVEPISPLE